jgi:hypothetical protein
MTKKKQSITNNIISIALICCMVTAVVETALIIGNHVGTVGLLLLLASATLGAFFELGRTVGQRQTPRESIEETTARLVADYIARTILDDDDRLMTIASRAISDDDVRERMTVLVARHLYGVHDSDTASWARMTHDLYPRKQAIDDFIAWLIDLEGDELASIARRSLDCEESDVAGKSHGELIALIKQRLQAKGDLQLLLAILDAVRIHHFPAINPYRLTVAETALWVGVLKWFDHRAYRPPSGEAGGDQKRREPLRFLRRGHDPTAGGKRR